MSDTGLYSEYNKGIDEGFPSVSQSDEDVYDTDLESDQGVRESSKVFGRSAYLKACRMFGVTPTSFFLRNIHQEELSMPHHGLGPVRAKALAFALMNNTSITILNLDDNCLEAEGGIYIAKMMTENCYVTSLNVSWNKLGSDGIVAMCEMLIVNTSLEVIDLSGNDITDNEAKMINEALMENFRIRVINLSHNHFGYKSAVEFCPALKENDTIEEIDLSWNQFDPKAIVHMCKSIVENSRLTTLNLSFNGIGNHGAEGIANLLQNNKVLKELNIGNCRISSKGGLLIATALKENDSLSVLHIDHNPIGTDGAKEILNSVALETSSVVEHLDLSGIEVDKTFMDVKKACQAKKKTITILHGKILGDYVIPRRPKVFGVLFRLTDASNIARHLESYGAAQNLNVRDAVVGIECQDELNLTPTQIIELILKCGLELNEEQNQFVLNIITEAEVNRAKEAAQKSPQEATDAEGHPVE